jgi:putative membrane-bound dehydrogenase-like protein
MHRSRPLTRSFRLAIIVVLTVGLHPAWIVADNPSDNPPALGFVPTDRSGRPLNLGFETGTLADWSATGDAFKGQPIEGDVVSRRRGDMKSGHAGRYWVGSYERAGDPARGTLTSVPFRVTKPFASFLVGAGSRNGTRAELVRKDSGTVIFRASGDDLEDMERVVVDLSPHLGQEISIRLIDEETTGWGHINFDDFLLHDTRPVVPPRRRPLTADLIAHDGLEPEAAARAMTVPPGFQVRLFAGEPDVVQPIAMAIDDRGRLWVAEAYSYPVRVPEKDAKDRILIFEDTNNDGHFDTRKVFAEHLNLVSGIEVGFGGVWVGAAPQFLFIPDRDGDDKPDSAPQVVLDGWGYQDSHETLNTFTWGPDGWLYGCHGVFTHSRVGKPGTPDRDRIPLNAAVWRYHPTRHTFEVFASGTSNPWGIAFDTHGQLLITSCVIPHLYHLAQGGRYERQAGQHFNPFTYDDIKTIADHRHYMGANPHAGNGRSASAGGGHAHAGAMIYLEQSWPPVYRGSLFMNNIHGARLNRDTLNPDGSGFVGSHAPDFLLANDVWSQIVHIEPGPDGSAFLIDWYDKNQCHHHDVNAHDRTNGRIFKVIYGTPAGPVRDLAKLDSAELVRLQRSTAEWPARHSRRILQERGPSASVDRMLEDLAKADLTPLVQLRVFWTRHAVSGVTQGPALEQALGAADPYVRAWAIQLSTERATPAESILLAFAELARTDPSPVVRLYLASALQRLPVEMRWAIAEGLLAHSEDAADPNLPLMDWYGIEPLAAADARRAIRLASQAKIPRISEFMARRVGAIGTAESLAILVEELSRPEVSASRLSILAGIRDALRGRRQVSMPAPWPSAFAALSADSNPSVRSQAIRLSMTFGDSAARDALRRLIADPHADARLRGESLSALVEARVPGLAPSLLELIRDPALSGVAIRALSTYDDPSIAPKLISAYASLAPSLRRDALNTMAARRDTARSMFAAVEAGKLPRGDLTADLIRQVRNLKDPVTEEQISRLWGRIAETSGDRARLIASFKTLLTSPAPRSPDLSLGRAVFTKTCQQCHALFGIGGKVGPELTGSNRADLDYLLSNVLDPSALIGKDYLANIVATGDGRVLTGIIRAEDRDTVTLVTANETVILPKSEIADRRQSEQSMMPEDLLKPLSEHEVRSLVAYLASPAQVPGVGEEVKKAK